MITIKLQLFLMINRSVKCRKTCTFCFPKTCMKLYDVCFTFFLGNNLYHLDYSIFHINSHQFFTSHETLCALIEIAFLFTQFEKETQNDQPKVDFKQIFSLFCKNFPKKEKSTSFNQAQNFDQNITLYLSTFN